MSRFAAFEITFVADLLDENQRAMAERGYRWCILDKDLRRICSLHLRQEIADRRALSLESTRTRRPRKRIA
jgi:hypothetical protein